MTVQELNTLFGRNVKYYRKKKGYKQKRLEKEIGCAAGVISDYEKGRHIASGKIMVLLCLVLGVEPWQLFYQEK